MAVKRLLLRRSVKSGGIFPCTLEEHANAEQSVKSTLNGAVGYYKSYSNGATLISCTITITLRSCIVIVAGSFPKNVVSSSLLQIQRGGVNKTLEETRAANADATGIRTHLLYGTEVLDPGVYQYDLVNVSGDNITTWGSAIKADAIACPLVDHANAEQAVKESLIGTTTPWEDTFVNGAALTTCTIATTKATMIVIVAISMMSAAVVSTQIQRGGVNKTLETTISGGDAGSERVHLLYGTELLAAGNYQYGLINTSGGNRGVCGSCIKAVAVEA